MSEPRGFYKQFDENKKKESMLLKVFSLKSFLIGLSLAILIYVFTYFGVDINPAVMDILYSIIALVTGYSLSEIKGILGK